MKKMIITLLLLPAIALLASTTLEPIPIGTALPKADKELKDISGQEITLNKAKKENGLLVMFSCNTCPVVINNQSRTNEICQFALQKNVGVVLLNSNEA